MPANRSGEREAQAAETGRESVSVAPQILLLAVLLKRSGNIAFKNALGLSPLEWSLIARLGDGGPQTQSEMVERYLMDKGQLSRVAVQLARVGLIEREGGQRRSLRLSLAPKGRKVFAQIKRISFERNQAITKGLTKRDLAAFTKALKLLSNNAAMLRSAPNAESN